MDDKVVKDKNRSLQALAIQIGSTATAWVVVPALLAVYGGRWLDRFFSTEPKLFISAMVLAFIVTLTGIIKMAKDYLKQEEKDSK